jgi:hypothetical protein
MGRFAYARYAGYGFGRPPTHSLRCGLLSFARYAGYEHYANMTHCPARESGIMGATAN